MDSIEERQKRRRQVASDVGHPWPWRVRELVEEHAVERDVDLRELADRWGCGHEVLAEWVRRHGFRTENYRAVRRE